METIQINNQNYKTFSLSEFRHSLNYEHNIDYFLWKTAKTFTFGGVTEHPIRICERH